MLWADDHFTRAAFDSYPVDTAKLPLRAEVVERMCELCEWHDVYLNWASPAEPFLWRQEECDRFNAAVAALYEQVVRELSSEFEMINTQQLLEEDPDLERYLRDPINFRR